MAASRYNRMAVTPDPSAGACPKCAAIGTIARIEWHETPFVYYQRCYPLRARLGGETGSQASAQTTIGRLGIGNYLPSRKR